MKNKGIILSFLLVPFLVNCNKGPSYTVNPQEMYDALTMKGVDYLQWADSDNGYEAFTPITYHVINEDGDYPYHYERIVINDGVRQEEYGRETIEEELKPIEFKEEDFCKISDFVDDVLAVLSDRKYSDFVYDEKTKEYMIDTWDEYDTYHNAIRFLNKKVDYFDSWGSDRTRETAMHYTFGYEKIEPPIPTPTPTLE